jgi:hypothetical protein
MPMARTSRLAPAATRRRPWAGIRPDELGRASRERCVQLHSPVRFDGDRQHARLLDARTTGQRDCARSRRSVARPRRGCLVASLSVTRRDVCRHRRCATEPQRHPYRARIVTASWPAKQLLPPIESPKPARVLGETLRAIAARYGAHTADFRCHAARIPKGNAIRRLLIGEGQGSGSNRMKRLDETMPCARAHVAARSRMTKAVASVAA